MEYKQGKRIMGMDGVETTNDMYHENTMLSKETQVQLLTWSNSVNTILPDENRAEDEGYTYNVKEGNIDRHWSGLK